MARQDGRPVYKGFSHYHAYLISTLSGHPLHTSTLPLQYRHFLSHTALLLGLPDPDVEGIIILQNVGHYSLKDTVSHP
jgi:hypothetical protein